MSEQSRQLIRCQDDILLYELTSGRARSFEVVAPDGEHWRFSLPFSAESKFERLISAQKQKGVR